MREGNCMWNPVGPYPGWLFRSVSTYDVTSYELRYRTVTILSGLLYIRKHLIVMIPSIKIGRVRACACRKAASRRHIPPMASYTVE
jgi:hypothetical protein